MANPDPFKQSQAKITGDPGIALIAQVNRFIKPEAPLVPGDVSPFVVGAAIAILQERLTRALVTSSEPLTLAAMSMELAQATKDPVAYVRANRDLVTRTLAAYGDSRGLPKAVVGITGADRTAWSSGQWFGALAGAFFGGVALVLVTKRAA
jgi:hypothetical protein